MIRRHLKSEKLVASVILQLPGGLFLGTKEMGSKQVSVRRDTPLLSSHFKRDESGTPGSNHMISIIPENKLECTFVV